nr:hypothetical protein [Tanacetum cinerariifolium]
KQEEKRIEEEQAANARYWKIPACCDDDDDYNSAITPVLSTEEPVDSLSMRDKHLDTIPATKSDDVIKSSVEDLVPIPSEFKESMPNHDSSIIISSKIDSLFDEFASELTLLESFPPGIDETDCHPEKEIRFAKRLLYDNSSPRPPEEIVSDISNADIESFSPSPIPNKDNYDDSERDILILEELLDNYSLSLPTNESYHFDIPSPYRPPAKPPDGNTGTLNIKMLGDVSDQKPSAECPMIINGKNTPVSDVPLFHFYPLDQLKYGGISSQPMLKSSYKAEVSVIISIPPLVEGVADVVVEIKGTGWSISITFRFSVGLQTPDDLSRSRLGFIEKMGVHG